MLDVETVVPFSTTDLPSRNVTRVDGPYESGQLITVVYVRAIGGYVEIQREQ